MVQKAYRFSSLGSLKKNSIFVDPSDREIEYVLLGTYGLNGCLVRRLDNSNVYDFSNNLLVMEVCTSYVS